jgi:hypothetical protein
LLEAFNRRAAREPRLWEKAVLLLLAVAVPIWLGSERGVAVGVIAGAAYGALFVLASFRHRQLVEWSQAHPYLDLLWLPPLAFVAVAGLSDWPLGLCVAVALAGSALVGAVAVGLRRRRASA